MKENFRQSMAWLHTWSGLLFGWLLFVVFACGTTAYFQEEVTRWMQPEVTATADPARAAALGFAPAVDLQEGLARLAAWVREETAAPAP